MRRWIAPAALLAALAGAPAAGANGDPPSDVLPFEDVFVPAAASGAATEGLRGAVRQAAAAGYPLKVAVIHSAGDLGPLASVFGRPQQYADYLVTELPRHNPEATGLRILVAMPAGAAVAGPGVEGAERRAARTTRVSGDATPTQLVDAARTTVERMADAAGHPIGGGGGAAGGAIAAVLIGAIVLAAALAGIAARRRAGD